LQNYALYHIYGTEIVLSLNGYPTNKFINNYNLKKMKKLLLIFITLSMSVLVMAQEKHKQKEAGLVFSNLNNFGLTYKTGTNKSLWRFNTLIITGDNIDETADSVVNKQNQMGFGIKFGKEFRKIIVTNFELRYGADLSFTYNHTSREYDNTAVNYNNYSYERTTYEPGINLVLGFNYVFHDYFVIAAELLPHFTYRTGTSKENRSYYDVEIENDISGFSYGISNTSALLSLTYRF
jgi:hypothetical protein